MEPSTLGTFTALFPKILKDDCRQTGKQNLSDEITEEFNTIIRWNLAPLKTVEEVQLFKQYFKVMLDNFEENDLTSITQYIKSYKGSPEYKNNPHPQEKTEGLVKSILKYTEELYRSIFLGSLDIKSLDTNKLDSLLNDFKNNNILSFSTIYGDKIKCPIEGELVRKLRYKSRDWGKSAAIADAFNQIIGKEGLRGDEKAQRIFKNTIIKYVDFIGINNSNINKILKKKIMPLADEEKGNSYENSIHSFLESVSIKLSSLREKEKLTTENTSLPKIAITYTRSGGAHVSIFNAVKHQLANQSIISTDVDESNLVHMKDDTFFKCTGLAHADIYNKIGQQKGQMDYAKKLKELDNYLKIFLPCTEPARFRKAVNNATLLYSASNHPRNVTFVADQKGRKAFFQLCDYGKLSDKLQSIAKAVIKYDLDDIIFLAPSERTTYELKKLYPFLAAPQLNPAKEGEIVQFKSFLEYQRETLQDCEVKNLCSAMYDILEKSSNEEKVAELKNRLASAISLSKDKTVKALYNTIYVMLEKIIVSKNSHTINNIAKNIWLEAKEGQKSEQSKGNLDNLSWFNKYKQITNLCSYPVNSSFLTSFTDCTNDQKIERLQNITKEPTDFFANFENTRIWIMTMGSQGVGGVIENYLDKIIKSVAKEIKNQSTIKNILLLILCGTNAVMLRDLPNYFTREINAQATLNGIQPRQLNDKIRLKALSKIDPSEVAVLGKCCHVFLSKPGGGTSAEVLTGELPMAIHREKNHYWEFGNIEELILAGALETREKNFYSLASSKNISVKKLQYPLREVVDILKENLEA